MTHSEFLALLTARGSEPTGSGSHLSFRCPAHKDSNASLSVSEASDGKVLLHCHAGCKPEAICAKLGLKLADLFPGKPKGNGGKAAMVATYDYRDEGGNLLYQSVRYCPKDFKQRKPDVTQPDGWAWTTKGVRRVLYRLRETLAAIQRGEVIHVAEGEKDVAALVEHGFAATCNVGGAGKWRSEYTATLQGADVVIVADKDAAGRKHAADVAAKLQGVAASVKVIELPDINCKPVKDAADFFEAGGTAVDFDAICAVAPEWTAPTQPTQAGANTDGGVLSRLDDPRPKIQLPGDNRLLSDTAREFAAILKATGKIYKRGGFAFTLNANADALQLMGPDTLRTWVEDHLVCFKIRKLAGTDETIQFKRTLTQADAAGILASPQFLEELPPVERLNPVRMPVMRRSGLVELLPAGYDPETESLTVDSVPFPVETPVNEAKRLLAEVFGEFIFADSGRSLAVAVAAALAVFARGLLPRKSLRPCFVFLANAEGAGKTLLVKVATVPVLGYAPVGTAPKNEDEMQKVLLTAIMEARAVLFLDNFKRHIASESLEAFLTASEWEGRILGQSKSFRGENDCLVFITGNGATVSPDVRRRSLFCELFLEAERAEDRVFKNNLEVPTLLEKRAEILGALWALIVDWDKAGRPKPTRGNSSFTDWADVIGGIVQHAGFACPLEAPALEAAADTDGSDMRALVTAIAGSSQRKAVSFDELVTLARGGGLFERVLPADGDLDAKTRSVLGKLFGRYDRRLVGGFRFLVEGKGHSRAFKVEKLDRSPVARCEPAASAPPEPEPQPQPVSATDAETL